MKILWIFPLAVMLLLAPAVYAGQAETLFSASERDPIQLVMNGKMVNEIPTQQVYVQERPGRHVVEIKVFTRGGRLQFIHKARILVKPNTRNNFILQTHPYGNVRLVQQSKTIIQRSVAPKVPKPIRHPRPLVAQLSQQELWQLQEALLYQPSDHHRLILAKKNLHHKYLYTEDVRELLYLFEHEYSRLHFAKYALRQVSDPQHYRSVYDAFYYPSSVHQLENLMARAY